MRFDSIPWTGCPVSQLNWLTTFSIYAHLRLEIPRGLILDTLLFLPINLCTPNELVFCFLSSYLTITLVLEPRKLGWNSQLLSYIIKNKLKKLERPWVWEGNTTSWDPHKSLDSDELGPDHAVIVLVSPLLDGPLPHAKQPRLGRRAELLNM
jgi:hypothetical protein